MIRVVKETVIRIPTSIRSTFDRSVGGLAWAVVRAISRDMTNEIGKSRLLVLAPHPDDETLACGGCIVRALTDGGNASVLVATDGRYSRGGVPPEEMVALRRVEFFRAAATLGLSSDQVEWWGYEDASLASHHSELVERLQELVQRRKPTVILAPWACDTHPDHAALGHAARAAVTGSQVLLLEYVVWAWTQPSQLNLARHGFRETLKASSASPAGWRCHRPIVVRTANHLPTKTLALAAHRSQLGPSANEVGLPSGEGALDAKFLGRFLQPEEFFFRCS